MPRPTSATPRRSIQLASLYLDGNGVTRDPKRAVPWLVLAANKGHYKSQAVLGRILFNGEHGMRQRASGLMWLTVACDGPGAKEPWIAELRETAVKQASDDERALALILLKRWVEAGASRSARGDLSSALRVMAEDEPGHERSRLSRCGLDACGRRGQTRDFMSISRSTYTGTWSDGRSQERTCLSMPAVVSRSAACGDSSRWSMRMPQFFCQAPA